VARGPDVRQIRTSWLRTLAPGADDHGAQSAADATRARSRRYLKPGFGCLHCSRRGCFVCFCCLVDALPEQCLRRRPRTNPLFAAVFYN
jgi:hypothetical protein